MQENLKTNFKFAGIIFLNIVIVLAEIYYGVISNSITLFSLASTALASVVFAKAKKYVSLPLAFLLGEELQ